MRSGRDLLISIPNLALELSPQQSARRGPASTAIAGLATLVPETPTLAASGDFTTVTVDSANCRPKKHAEKIAFLYRDQQVEIVGRNDDPNNPW